MQSNEFSTKENSRPIGNEVNFEKYFCQACLQYPEYVIKIDKDGFVFLSHKCIENEEVQIDVTKLEEFNSKFANKFCHNCKRIAFNICLKCGLYICDQCVFAHETINRAINDIYREMSVFPLVDSQYYCKQHLNKVTHFCGYCKINLCEQECILEHFHCKNEPLNNNKNSNPSGYNGKNQTLKNLADLSKAFCECYKNGIKNSKMTINIMLNFYLIEGINSFINKTKNNNDEIQSDTITNKFSINKEESYMFRKYGNEDFKRYYFKLIINAQQGNIKKFHKLMDIEKKYKKLNKVTKEVFSFKQYYIITLKLELDRYLDDLVLISNINEFRDFPLIILDLKQKNNQLENLQNQMELDFDLMKKFLISIDHRVDFELRRKIGNIILDKILDIYGNKIDEIEKTIYLLSMAIEDIEKKIFITNLSNNKKEKENILKDLTNKYQKALDLLKSLTLNKIKNIADVNRIKPPLTNINYKYKSNINQNGNDIHEETILNLFFIIKKKLGDSFNRTVHNETVKLNYLAKGELDKYEKEKEKENQNLEEKEITKDILKNEILRDNENGKNHNTNEIENENLIKGEEDINSEKTKENENSQIIKTCKKMKIISIKRDITIASDKFKSMEISFDKTKKKNNFDMKTSLNEFYQHLKKKETQLFDINTDLNIDSALNLYFKGEKSQVMIPVKNNEKKESEENIEKKKIDSILEGSNQSQSVDEIKMFLTRINNIVDNNIDNIKLFQKRSLDFIEDYGEFFDIKDIIKKTGLSLPLKYSDIYYKVKKIEKCSVNSDDYENCFYICNIYAFLYYEKFIESYNQIKEKIKQLNLDNAFILNEAKNYLLKEVKDRINSISYEEKLIQKVWKQLEKEEKIINDININKNIKNYIKKNNLAIFQEDLSKLCGEKIKSINLKNADPQNIFLKPFMKQNGLYYDMK